MRGKAAWLLQSGSKKISPVLGGGKLSRQDLRPPSAAVMALATKSTFTWLGNVTQPLPHFEARKRRTDARAPWLRRCANPRRQTPTWDRGRCPLRLFPGCRECLLRPTPKKTLVYQGIASYRCPRGQRRRHEPLPLVQPRERAAIVSATT